MTASIWVRRGTFDWEGLAIVLLTISGLFMALVVVMWTITPEYVCASYKTVDVIEQRTVGTQVREVAVTKSICAKWEEAKP